jgi:uncharacterized protein YpmS
VFIANKKDSPQRWRKWITLFQLGLAVILMISTIFNHCANHAMHENPQKNAINETKADQTSSNREILQSIIGKEKQLRQMVLGSSGKMDLEKGLHHYKKL